MTPEEAKAEKQRLKEEKKQLKKEQKDQKKAARARAKEIASQEADLADDEFAEETAQEELHAQNHTHEREVEVGRLGHEHGVVASVEVVEFDTTHQHHGDETEEEHQRAEQAEEVHRLLSECA